MFDINREIIKNCGMSPGKRRKRDDVLAAEIGKRIKELMGDLKRTDIAGKIGIAPSTLWDYMNGDAIPGPEILIKLADILNVSIDYLLKGQQSLFAKNEDEKEALYQYRETEKLTVSEQYKRYGRFLINETKKQKKTNNG